MFANGAVSYVSQRPWIQNSTVRDGILFAREYEKEEYDLVVEASQLSIIWKFSHMEMKLKLVNEESIYQVVKSNVLQLQSAIQFKR